MHGSTYLLQGNEESREKEVYPKHDWRYYFWCMMVVITKLSSSGYLRGDLQHHAIGKCSWVLLPTYKQTDALRFPKSNVSKHTN